MTLARAKWDTGDDVSVVISNDSNQYADVVAEALESYDGTDIADYEIPASGDTGGENGSSGTYFITFPSWLPADIYTLEWVPRAGATLAESDMPNCFNAPSYYWDGTNLWPVNGETTRAILQDTGTTLPAQITALNNLSQAEANAACDEAISDAALATAAGLATTESNIRGSDSDDLKDLSDALDDATATPNIEMQVTNLRAS